MMLFKSYMKLTFYVFIPVIIIFIPTTFLVSAPSVCLIKNIIHVECPGCGITKAISSIFHGELINAYKYNHMIVVIFPVLCYLWIKNIVKELKNVQQ